MGKTKMYAITEDVIGRQNNRNVPLKHAKQAKMPGRVLIEEKELPTLHTLFRQILIRLKRNWIALRFQANRYTLGVFRERTILKLSTLSLLGYLLLFTDQDNNLFSGTEYEETALYKPVETSLEVEDKPKGKSLIFRPKEHSIPVNKTKTIPAPKNDAAPVGVQQMKHNQADRYIARYASIAVQEMKKYGIPASISLAQGLVESRFGTSKLAVRNNNHFGMKCFSKKCRNGHCSNHLDDHHKDFFRIFKNPWESWRAHSQMLANGRYASLKKYGRNYRHWALGLERLGYATDRTYAEKLIGVIERYDLHRFDR